MEQQFKYQTSRSEVYNVSIIQIWHCGECNITFYGTLENYIARGEAECNIIFQSAIESDIVRTIVPYMLYYMTNVCSLSLLVNS